MSTSSHTVDTQDSEALARCAAQAAADKQADDIRVLDLGDLLAITDYFVIVSARNELQLSTLVDNVERGAREQLGRKPRRREGTKDTGWIILDYGDVVVHAFTAEQRDYYDLERLWSDAPVVPFTDAAAGARRDDGATGPAGAAAGAGA